MATDQNYSAAGGSPLSAGGPPGAPNPLDLPGGSSIYEDQGYGSDAALDAFTGQFTEIAPVNPGALHAHDVTAVLVAHNGSRWLPRVLEGLAGLTHTPDRLIAVDTGSRDDTGQLLTAALGAPAVVSAPRSLGYGAAVAQGVQAADEMGVASRRGRVLAAERTEWIWLLHDDSTPAPDALQRLLETAVRRPDAGVIGPKVLSWRGDRQLLEVGVTVSGSGRRHTGLDRREYDQGQHDETKEVLAVGSAGMLIRRDVWEELGGFDPVLSVFRDDIDFCWRANRAGHPVVVSPEAVVYHAEAAAHGRRRLGATRLRPHLADRRNALYVVLVNSRLAWLPFLLLRVIIGGLGRSVGFLFGKQPALAVEELGAVFAVLGRPDRLVRGRSRRRRLSRPHTQLRPLFPPRGQQLRNAGENLLSFLSGSGSGHDVSGASRRASASSEDEVPTTDDAFLLRFLLHPLMLAGVGLVLLTLLAARDLIGGGHLMGGALLPTVSDPADLWRSYTESWHGVGLGSGTAAPPYLAVVAVVATLVRSAAFAVDLLLLGSVLLAGVSAYFLLRRLVSGRWLRVWGSVTYGLLPAVTGAVAAGRLGTVVATILTPPLVLALYRTVGRPGSPGPFRAAWSAGLILAVMAAFVPLAWILMIIIGGVGVATVYRDRATALRFAVIVAIVPVVLIPWSGNVLSDPVLLVTEAGMPGPGLSDDELAPWSVLLQQPGGPGGAPIWLGAGLVLAGWAALLRSERRLLVSTAWAVVGAGLVVGIVVSRLAVTGPTLETPVAGWPGYPAVLIGGALIVAAVVAGEGARSWLARTSFGWLQPLVALAAAAALLVPLVSAVWWVVDGADDPLERRDPAVLPAYISAEAEQPERIRTLVISRADDGRVTYSLLRSSGPRMGDAESGPEPDKYTALDETVADIVSGRGAADGASLAVFAVKYVYLEAPFDPDLADILDTIPGLARASAPEGAAMWRVDQPVGRATLIQPPPEGEESADAPSEPVIVPTDEIEASTDVPAGDEGRLLVLAELADSGWSATLNGSDLTPVVYDGWAQAFEIGAEGGELELSHRGTQRAGVLLIQLGLVIIVTVLALPGMRRQKGAVDDASDIDPDEPTSPDLPVVAGAASTTSPTVPAGAARVLAAATRPAGTAGAVPPEPAQTPPETADRMAYPPAQMPPGQMPPDRAPAGSAQMPTPPVASSWPEAPAQPPAPPQASTGEPASGGAAAEPGRTSESTSPGYRGRRARRSDEPSTEDSGGYRGRRAAGRRSGGHRGRRDGEKGES
ncbi:glycosyltransferase family 2 protein [Phytoactinopolyspora halotolerans]|uniref:Glycosyltransferase n=1 Tax=Phytoactinopolyspora halotolerans TaxID=1981512 RepID=A0A6L9SFF2_9ACTN|nr:glycosyltransferase family 2 protein [Phytoactinopolyspora halotolerans]NEE04105.1 glycosyltransferase [Phytoactinopolyspora halotolerans]